jgi:hypothetical protein
LRDSFLNLYLWIKDKIIKHKILFLSIVEPFTVLLTGLIGSIFSSEISLKETYFLSSDKKLNVWVTIFYLLVFLTLIVFSISSYLRRMDRLEDDENKQKVFDLLITQPHDIFVASLMSSYRERSIAKQILVNFLNESKKLDNEASEATSEVTSEATSEAASEAASEAGENIENNGLNDTNNEINMDIARYKMLKDEFRTALTAICNLADSYVDGKVSDSKDFTANIMFFIEANSESLSSTIEKDDIFQNCIFLQDNYTVESSHGFLLFNKEFSSASKKTENENQAKLGNPAVDLNLKSLIFNIPKKFKSDDGKTYYVLPGAPLAFIDETSSFINDIQNIDNWLEKIPFDFDNKTKNFFSGYIKNKKFNSFLSIPIPVFSLSDQAEKVVAVLNIYSVNKNFFYRRNKGVENEIEKIYHMYDEFIAMMFPFTKHLSDLTILLYEHSEIEFFYELKSSLICK